MTMTIQDLCDAGLGSEELELLVDVVAHRVTNPSLYFTRSTTAHKVRDLFWVRSVLEPVAVVDERLEELA